MPSLKSNTVDGTTQQTLREEQTFTIRFELDEPPSSLADIQKLAEEAHAYLMAIGKQEGLNESQIEALNLRLIDSLTQAWISHRLESRASKRFKSGFRRIERNLIAISGRLQEGGDRGDQ